MDAVIDQRLDTRRNKNDAIWLDRLDQAMGLSLVQLGVSRRVGGIGALAALAAGQGPWISPPSRPNDPNNRRFDYSLWGIPIGCPLRSH